MSGDEIRDVLAGNAFFEGLDEASLDLLADHAKARHVQANEILFHHDETADRFFIVRSGRVALEVPAIEGPNLEVQSIGPGSLLGWSWLIPPYKWQFRARAAEPGELLELDGEAIRAQCEQDPRLGYELMKRFAGLMSDRMVHARRKMMDEWNPPGFA
jgi:CRP-like cAMP-binding protein